MEIFIIILGIFILYWRIFNYYYIIDDIVPRYGYLYCVPETSPSPSFYSTRPPKTAHLLTIFIHSINTWIIYSIWGWVPAILFAFSPLSVVGTAWITGSYYAVTTLFVLTSYFFIQHYPNFIGAGLGTMFFTAALGSTITCLGFPFMFILFNKWGLVLFVPMFLYLTGRRFNKGYQIRDMGKQDSFNLKKIPVMIKVVAYYIYMVVFPYKLLFFRQFGEDYVRDEDTRKDMESFNGWFYVSLFSIIAFISIGSVFSFLGVVWFLFTIAPFSQFKVLGQFVAERYVYLPSIGWYLILGNALAPCPILLWLVVGLYLIRSHLYIPTYRSIESLYEEGIKNDPSCLANYANLGERYIHMGRLWEGKEILAKGLEVDPESFLCHTNTAAYWVQVKNMQKAIYYTEKSIELGRKKSSWFIVHAMTEQMKSILGYEKHLNSLVNGDDVEAKKQEEIIKQQHFKNLEMQKELSSALAVG